LIDKKQHQCNIKKTTWIDKTAPVQHKKATWIDKTAPVQHKKHNLETKQHQCNMKRFYVALVLFCLQVVFFMLHWYCFVYPGCLFMLDWCCFVYPGCLFYVALVLFYLSRLSFLCFTGTVLSIQAVIFMLHWIDKTVPVQHKKDNLETKLHQCNIKRQPG
jgi:hypothetical protein